MLALLLLAGIGVVSNFEGGNIGKVEQVSPAHLRCAVQGQSDQDHRNRQANWYYFELVNLPRTPVTIDLVDLAGEYNYRSPAYSVTKATRPVYSYDGVAWSHFSDQQVSWDSKEPHLTVQFEPQKDHVWIAHVPPYTNKDLARLVDAFGKSPFLRQESVGRTVLGRPMPLLTITNPAAPEASKKVIWLMFRQHAWETGSSWVGDGAVRFLLSDDPRARRIRDENIFKIFPMADPDGAATGGVRFNKNGYDLNRNWDTIDPHAMPEIAAQHKAILDWVDSGHPLHLFLSLHNDEGNEYLEAPAAYHALGERLWRTLSDTTTFNPTSRLRDQGETTTPGKPGRMQVNQGLFHDRKLPAMLMEQTVDLDPKLGRCPTISDRQEFGAGLVRAMAAAVSEQVGTAQIRWVHLSSSTGDLPIPGESHQQTGALPAKIDPRGGTDFVLSFRQAAPALVWYRHSAALTWTRYVIEDALLPLEAGGAAYDIDGDGDLDIVFGGDYQSNELWWWENPSPNFDPKVPWKRHVIKNSGAKQHHDQIFADLKHTGRPQLVFWNQKAKTIFLAEIPADPRHSGPWPLEAIFQDSAAAGGKSYPEGIDAIDVDGDGAVDLLAGNYWFKYEDGRFRPIRVGTIGGRIRGGYFKPGRTPQIVIAPGDGSGPLRIYEAHGDPAQAASWVGRDLLDRDMIHGHTLDIGDVNGDGNLDILAAEMAQWTDGAARPDNPNATAWILYGDGQGNFERTVLKVGDGWHEGKLGDFDDDGRLGILNKPYTWSTPRIDLWLNKGR